MQASHLFLLVNICMYVNMYIWTVIFSIQSLDQKSFFFYLICYFFYNFSYLYQQGKFSNIYSYRQKSRRIRSRVRTRYFTKRVRGSGFQLKMKRIHNTAFTGFISEQWVLKTRSFEKLFFKYSLRRFLKWIFKSNNKNYALTI